MSDKSPHQIIKPNHGVGSVADPRIRAEKAAIQRDLPMILAGDGLWWLALADGTRVSQHATEAEAHQALEEFHPE